ncbi:MAG TPA: hypothetical protein VKZ41_13140 [Gemmatimonadales bacterium]|nr:hypothetical protein [Gemmatimonadales bacterium]
MRIDNSQIPQPASVAPRGVLMSFRNFAAAALTIPILACGGNTDSAPDSTAAASGDIPRTIEAHPEERFFGSIRQLTDGGENAEAYFSRDGSRLIFQSSRDGRECDQQYVMNADGSDVHMVSTGEGKTTCGYFYDNDQRILFSSTHAVERSCPAALDPSSGYVWGLDPYDIYTARPDGTDLQRLTNHGVYTTEATLSPDGETILFTSLKDGDLDIYTMNTDGSNVRRLTNSEGYDGGAFFSPDGSKIVYRAYHSTDSAEMADYKALLEKRMVRPNRMEIWVMNADGSGQRQVTNLGGANFAPFFAPDGERIIFSSNHTNPRSRNFDLYMVNLDGTNLTQVTFDEEFDGFPMFSPDGKYLVWASNRNARVMGETNVFIAEWQEISQQ